MGMKGEGQKEKTEVGVKGEEIVVLTTNKKEENKKLKSAISCQTHL